MNFFGLNLMAETAVSGDWLIELAKGIIVAIGTGGAAWIVAFRKGRAMRQKVTLEEPLPTMPVQRTYTPPSFSQHQDLVRRVKSLEEDAKEHREHVETQLRDIRREQSEQFVKLMNAGESRKDMIMESMNEMVRSFHSRVDQLIDGHRTPPNRKS